MKKLFVLLSIALLLVLIGCGNANMSDNCELEAPIDGPFAEGIIGEEGQANDPKTEAKPTYATLEWRFGITLNYPRDWRYWTDNWYLLISPQGRPYLSTWYERTVFEITHRSLNPRHEQDITICPEEWLRGLQNVDYSELILIDGVQAIYRDFVNQQINRTMHPYARNAVLTFIHMNRLFSIELRSGDGCLEEWAVMEAIRDSIRFSTSVIDSADDRTVLQPAETAIEFITLPNGTRVDTRIDDEVVSLILRHFESLENGDLSLFRTALGVSDDVQQEYRNMVIIGRYFSDITGIDSQTINNAISTLEGFDEIYYTLFKSQFPPKSRNLGLTMTEMRLHPYMSGSMIETIVVNRESVEKIYQYQFWYGDEGWAIGITEAAGWMG